MFGICLGHQLLSRAGGPGDVQAPVRPPRRQPPGQGPAHRAGSRSRSQNHGFAVAGKPGEIIESDLGAAQLTHVNLYDGTIEGIRLLDVPAGCVQYHPEAGPGPNDSPRPLRRVHRAVRGRMPRRDDLHKILVLGSGPIVIGQAAEFDYSGAQACKVLLEEGYEVVLVNSNPATIMTDPEFATATYVEPLLPGPVHAGDRARAPGRAAADARRPDRAQPRQDALRGRHAGAIRRRADRRRTTTRSTAPRTASSSTRRCRPPACAPRATSSPPRTRRRTAALELRPAADHPPGVHARRPRRRHRPHARAVRARSSRAASTRPRSARS